MNVKDCCWESGINFRMDLDIPQRPPSYAAKLNMLVYEITTCFCLHSPLSHCTKVACCHGAVKGLLSGSNEPEIDPKVSRTMQDAFISEESCVVPLNKPMTLTFLPVPL